MGAGILPVALYRGTLYLLLGQERHNNLLCDFGGSPNPREDVFDTATREGCEELNGLLGDVEMVKSIVADNLLLTIKDGTYTSFIFNLEYDTKLPYYFNNLNSFAEMYLNDKVTTLHNGLFEKNEIKWYKLNELNKLLKIKNKNKENIIRSHYKNILTSVISNEEFLINKLR